MSIFTRIAFNLGNADKIVMDMREMERMIQLLSQSAQRIEQTPSGSSKPGRSSRRPASMWRVGPSWVRRAAPLLMA